MGRARRVSLVVSTVVAAVMSILVGASPSIGVPVAFGSARTAQSAGVRVSVPLVGLVSQGRGCRRAARG